MTGLILAACVGSSIAAATGNDGCLGGSCALEVMSHQSEVRFLVMPRLVAMCIMAPPAFLLHLHPWSGGGRGGLA